MTVLDHHDRQRFVTDGFVRLEAAFPVTTTANALTSASTAPLPKAPCASPSTRAPDR